MKSHIRIVMEFETHDPELEKRLLEAASDGYIDWETLAYLAEFAESAEYFSSTRRKEEPLRLTQNAR